MSLLKRVRKAWDAAIGDMVEPKRKHAIELTEEQMARLDAAHDTVDEMLPEPELQLIFALERVQAFYDIEDGDDGPAPPDAKFAGGMFG